MQIAEKEKIELSFFTPEIMKVLKNMNGMRSKYWNEAFGYYNQNNEKPLYKSGAPCYIKVYYFIKNQLDANS